MQYNRMKTLPWIAISVFFLVACHQWDNFTTYFNTYYNAERIMKEVKEEFDYTEENRRVLPHVYIPEPDLEVNFSQQSGPPQFMKEFIIDRNKLQPVKIKIDSILIKGSKILAYHPKSDYVQGTLFLMAQAYFFRSEWIPSQVKCSELIDKFPDGELSPDAHLLLAKSLIIQKKFISAKTLLSRTVDVAWQLERYDILSEAFRIEAELALYLKDEEGALRPYKQAIAQTDDSEMQARWTIDLAALMYRMKMFDKAATTFEKAREEASPDYLAEFESYLYEAACYDRTDQFNKADEILLMLDDDGKWEEWKGYIFAEKFNQIRIKGDDSTFKEAIAHIDSTYFNNPLNKIVFFEKGMDYYDDDNWIMARNYFARAKNLRTPIYDYANKMYDLMSRWLDNKSVVIPFFQSEKAITDLTDSARTAISAAMFNLGRLHDQLNNTDSTYYYYDWASRMSPDSDKNKPRYMYVWGTSIRDTNIYRSDSLFDAIISEFPLTEYSKEAQNKMGYTSDFVIDTVKELYLSGSKLRKYEEYEFAVQQFEKLFYTYPDSKLSQKSIYTVGYIFENNLNETDSALFYYQKLLNDYPDSEYSKDVELSVKYLLALRSGEIPDELKTVEIKKVRRVSTEEMIKKQQDETRKQLEKNKKAPIPEGGPGGFQQIPGKIINNFKGMVNDPSKLIQKPEGLDPTEMIKMPENPFKQDSNKVMVPDSSKKK